MKLTASDLQKLLQYAKQAARQAGNLITDYADKNISISSKASGNSEASKILTEVDIQCQSLILKHLQDSIKQYDLAVLSEEMEDDKQRLIKQAFWCIDPLDGTLAFTQSQAGYSVSIALVSKEGEPLIGVVYDPVLKTMYTAIKGQGVERNGKPWQPLEAPHSNYLTLPCDRSLLKREDYPALREAIELWAIEQNLAPINERHFAGAVMNACIALENPPAMYFKLPKKEEGGGSSWDFAATACIYKESGAFVSNYLGNSLTLNSAETTYMNHHGVIYCTDKTVLALILSLTSS